MGVFDRLWNVGKGKLSTLKRSGDRDPDGALDRELAEMKRRRDALASKGTAAKATAAPVVQTDFDRRMGELKRLRAEGLLTREEFDLKATELKAEVLGPPKPPAVDPKPKKRTL